MGGGRLPVWSRNGHDLLFIAPDQRIRVVSYTTHGDSFSAGSARLWCAIPVADLGVNRSYDLAPDGKHLAVILPADEREERAANLIAWWSPPCNQSV